MVKGAKTIPQFKILEWVDSNFVKGSVKVTFDELGHATVTDLAGDRITVVYTPDRGIQWSD